MDAAEDTGSLIGAVLEGRYKLIREIGRGGMGVVFEAEHVQLGKPVAVKMMLGKYAENRDAVVRFEREALAASRIRNPHIIDITHIGKGPSGEPYVAMELLQGESLKARLSRTGQLAQARALEIMRQVLGAVGAAHATGIIHRDLKPENIFLVPHDGQDFVKLLDFGISKVMDTDGGVAATKLTTTGAVMGTPLYMAPEQAMGDPVDRGADIYACGVILYEMLAGRAPFEGAAYAQLVAKLLTQEPPLLGELRPGLPGKLVAAVHRALEKDAKDRFATAEAFAAALPREAAEADVVLASAETLDTGKQNDSAAPSHAAGEAAAVVASVRRTRSRKRAAMIGGASVLAVAAIAGVYVTAIGSHDRDARDALAHAPQPAAEAPPPIAAPVPPPAPVAPVAPTAPTGHLTVTTIPPSAVLIIDDTRRGVTPLRLELPVGRHRVHVEQAGYIASDEDDDVSRDSETKTKIAMQSAPVARAPSSPATHAPTTQHPAPSPARPHPTATPPVAATPQPAPPAPEPLETRTVTPKKSKPKPVTPEPVPAVQSTGGPKEDPYRAP